MQSQSTNPQFVPSSDLRLSSVAEAHPSITGDASQAVIEPIQFHSQFVDCMEMNADRQTVAEYLDAHQGWFGRCAQPMKVEPLGHNGYALVVGNFGTMGYEIEPKIGLHLLPVDNWVYRIETIPVPDYVPPGYDVDFRAAMELVTPDGSSNSSKAQQTHVEWQLDLKVTIQFPRFIYALPKPLLQRTGEQLLRQVVRQVSRRLTHRVQEDFHTSRSLNLPKRERRWFFQKSVEVDDRDSNSQYENDSHPNF
jgi:Protein of unknown function (DUF1997)